MILVLGAGKSGMSAKAFLEQRGNQVVMYDDKNPTTTSDIFDLCVISPGISINHPQVRTPYIGELELGFTVPHKKIIAVTGTNGKTSVCKMVHKALCRNRRPFARKSVLCGNVGVPVTSVAHELRKKTAVTEVSSFQLESAGSGAGVFRPNIAVILNITQDHLERHGTMEEYIRCKSQIFARQRKRDVLILNYDDENCRNLGGNSRKLYFSTTARVRGVYLDGKDIMLNTRRRARKLFSLDDFNEKQPHAIQNILATVLVCKLMRVSRGAIIRACKSSPRPHRLEYVDNLATAAGTVTFYNDSKATNIASTLAACRCFKSPVNLLLGGVAKGQDFSELFDNLPNVVQNIFVYGECAEQIVAAAKPPRHAQGACHPSIQEGNFFEVFKCLDLQEAVKLAANTGTGPRVVLLSPACASFDQFDNYEHRGETFRQIVQEIISLQAQ